MPPYTQAMKYIDIKPEDVSFDTKAIHGATGADVTGGSRNMPIHQTVCYHFEDAQHGGDMFALKREGNIYSRITNPTVGALENKITLLEKGTGATAAASGLAAQMLALLPLLWPGDEFIASRKVYGGSGSQFQYTFEKFGWQCTFVQPEDPENFRKALTKKTRAIFIESCSNPSGTVADIEAIAAIAHEAGVPLIVDNTIPSPALFNPIDYGADLVTHSLTKYVSGQSTSMAGAVVEAGTFDWGAHPEKFPSLATPNESYQGLVFCDQFKDKPHTIYTHAVGLRDLGSCLSPTNAFHVLNGCETLGVRMKKHVKNADKIAKFLEDHKDVAWVSYPRLKSHESYDLAKKYMPNGCGSVLTFGLKNAEAGQYVSEACALYNNVAHIGDSSSLIVHPASTTHRQLSAEDKVAANCGPEVIRLSLGLENSDDLMRDIAQAIKAALKKA